MPYIRNPTDPVALQNAGKAIIRLSETAFKKGPGATETEWQTFEKDPAAWLYRYGYRLGPVGLTADGSIPPAILRIQPVYDTPHVMHVKVPWAGDIDRNVTIPTSSEYTAGDFDAFLASYFVRRCR